MANNLIQTLKADENLPKLITLEIPITKNSNYLLPGK